MKKRLLAAIMSLCMIVSLLPVSALAYEGSPRQGNTVVRFYVVGTGSTKGYDVYGQPMSGGGTTPLYVTEDCALIEELTVRDSNAPQGGNNNGDEAVTAWLNQYAGGVPNELANLNAIVDTVNSVYDNYGISTRLKTDYFNTYEFESANWISSDKAYHVHVRLIREECTVTFNYNYEGAPDATTDKVGKGTAVTKPEDPTREDYTFTGWYTNKECTEKYDFSALVTKNITLYAGWEKDEPEVPPIDVTKKLTKVERGAQTFTDDLDNLTLYNGDKLTWEIVVQNNSS